MIKLYEVSKDKTKYHIVTDKEVIENLETSLNEKEQQIERLQEQLNECISFAEELCEALDYEGIFYESQEKELEKIKKWGVK